MSRHCLIQNKDGMAQKTNRLFQPDFPFKPSGFPFFYGWVILVVSTIGMIASIPGQTMGVSVFTDTFIEVLKVDRMSLTQAYLAGTALSGFFISAGGRLFDRMGARKFMVVAGLLYAIALFLVGQMDRIVSLFGMGGDRLFALIVASVAFFGIRFIGQGVITLCSRSMLSKWWNHLRGRMVAISGIFISFSFAIAPRVLDWEIEAFTWRGAFTVNALVFGIAMGVLGWIFFRDNPEECGLQMDNGWVPPVRNENPDTFLSKEFTYPEARRTYAFWIISGILAFQSLFGTAYAFHILDLARHFSVEKSVMLNFFIYTSIFSVLVNFAVGYISDRTRMRFLITFMGIMGALACTGILHLPHTTGKVLLIAGSAGSWGTFPVLSSVAFARYFGRKHIGAISGASMAMLVWGSAVGPFLFSAGHQYLGGYEYVFLASTFVYCALAIGGIFANNPSRMAASRPKA
jgi:OFA family oxalate/formate antiporter-like MFS transporter